MTLKNIKFNASKVAIARGGSVSGAFKHSPSHKSATFSVRFAKKGTCRYACTIHPGTTGTVTVR